MKVILEESQRNIMSCLFEISVPFSRIAEELPTTSGTNPQTLNNSHSACLRKLHCYCSLLRHQLCSRYLWQETRTANKTQIFSERIHCYFDELALENKLLEDRKGRLQIRGNLLPKYGCRKRSSPVLVTQMFQSFAMKHQMKRVIILRLRKM